MRDIRLVDIWYDIRHAWWVFRKWLGFGHLCDYTDAAGEYIGFCELPGMHRGRD